MRATTLALLHKILEIRKKFVKDYNINKIKYFNFAAFLSTSDNMMK